MTAPLLSIQDLAVGFRRDGTVTPAVHTLSLEIMPGETVALVGKADQANPFPRLPDSGFFPTAPCSPATSPGRVIASTRMTRPR